MKKVIRLTESDLERIIKKVINEQSTKPKGFFEREYRTISTTKMYEKGGRMMDDPFKMPEYFKPYIGLVVSELLKFPSIDDIAFGGGEPQLIISDLNMAYIPDEVSDPEKSGFQGVRAWIDVGTRSGSLDYYYDCKEKQWKWIWDNNDEKYQNKGTFNKKFFELGDFIQSKFCNSYITKPKRERA